MKKIILSAIIASVFMVSCTQQSSAVTGPKYTTSEKLAQGKTVFENTCNKCHELPETTKHDDAGWISTMNKMAPKAKLTVEQHQMVYDYLISVN